MRDFLAQPIPVARPPGWNDMYFHHIQMLQREKAAVGRVFYGQINIISRHADLAFGLKTGALKHGFVKRKGDGESHFSFVVALNHLQHILDSPKSKGPKGGVRVSFDSLDGVYLRETDLLGLIRSGYIGTHRIETEALKPIIQAVAAGKRALVLAWQKAIREGDQ